MKQNVQRTQNLAIFGQNLGLTKTRSGKFCTISLNIQSIKKTLTDPINRPYLG